MAAITVTGGHFESVRVFKHVEQFLPTYARPRFIRIRVRKGVMYSSPAFGTMVYSPVNVSRLPWTSLARSSM